MGSLETHSQAPGGLEQVTSSAPHRSSCSGPEDLRSVLQTPGKGLHHQHLEPTKVSVDIFSLIPLPAMTSWNWKKASPTPRVNLSSPSWHHCWLPPKGITVSSQLLGCGFPALREVKRPLSRRAIFTKIQ